MVMGQLLSIISTISSFPAGHLAAFGGVCDDGGGWLKYRIRPNTIHTVVLLL